MPDLRYAVDVSVDISDLATPEEAEEVRYLIEAAVAGYKPVVTATVREYPAF